MPNVIWEDLRALINRRPRRLDLIKWMLIHPGFEAVVHYRLSHWFHERGGKALAMLLTARCVRRTGAEIRPNALIGPGLVLRHPVGVVVGAGAVIGKDCVLLQGVTIGERLGVSAHDYPVLGDNVLVGAGAAILGRVTIGNDVIVGANAVVLSDAKDGEVVVGVPARTVNTGRPKSGAMNQSSGGGE